MKILHVVALMTPDNAYGGPVTVALNQCAELQRRGHEVVIAAASTGYGEPPEEVGGVPVRLFRAHQVIPRAGFAGLASPGLVRFVHKNARSFDVVHVHLARDFVTLPAASAALRSDTRVVVQTHGMIDPSDRLLARPLDALLTRRILRRANTVFHLTDDEAGWLKAVAGNSLRLQSLPNGVTVPDEAPPFPERPQVLFCGRLHARKRPLVFVEAAATLLREGIDADFTLVGADEGEGPGVKQRIEEFGDDRLRWIGAVGPDQVAELITESWFVALPAVDEPFPMAIVESLALGRAAVVTDSCGLRVLVGSKAGAVVDDSTDAFSIAVRELLAGDHDTAGGNAHEVARANLSIESVALTLENTYRASPDHRKVVIVQPYVPAYRVPLFEQLGSRLAEHNVELRVAAGRPTDKQAARGDSVEASFIDRVESWEMSVGGPLFGLKRVSSSVMDASLVVSELKATALENYWLTFRFQGRHALWGHVYSTVGESNRIDLLLERWLMRRSAHVFAYTDKGGSVAMAAGLSPSRVTALRNTVDTTGLRSEMSRLTPSAVNEFCLRHDLRGGLTVASVGALDDSKRIGFLLESIELLCARFPDLDVIIAGDGPRAEEVRSFAATRPAVFAVGRVDEYGKAVISQVASLLLNPGRVGLIAVESLVMGTPIATTDWRNHSAEIDYLQSGRNALITADSVTAFVRDVTGLLTENERLQALRAGALATAGRYELSYTVERFAAGILTALQDADIDPS
jgi:glycosyltransferase involved in cell wall biosynthesis